MPQRTAHGVDFGGEGGEAQACGREVELVLAATYDVW
jgi:hypothetical protein